MRGIVFLNRHVYMRMDSYWMYRSLKLAKYVLGRKGEMSHVGTNCMEMLYASWPVLNHSELCRYLGWGLIP